MNNQRTLTFIFLFIMVFIVPFGSWYYLKTGLNFRVNARDALIPKDSIDLKEDSLGVFVGKVTIVDIDPVKNKEVSTVISDQFGKIDEFQILPMAMIEKLPMAYRKISSFKDKDYILIDNKGMIRNAYINDLESIKKMIQHTAIVIPKPKELDIKVKNNINNE
jgi:hypothetical protein